MTRTALMVIDAQVNMFDPQSPVYAAEQMLARLQDLIRRARQHGTMLVYLRHNGPPGDVDAPGEPGWGIHPSLAPQTGEPVIDKFNPNGFDGTDLGAVLQEAQIERLVLAGMQTDFCVSATSRAAVAAGYEVVLAADVHSTYDSQEQSARETIDRYNRELASLAEVIPSQQIEF